MASRRLRLGVKRLVNSNLVIEMEVPFVQDVNTTDAASRTWTKTSPSEVCLREKVRIRSPNGCGNEAEASETVTFHSHFDSIPLMSWIAAGPTRMTKMPGKINRTSGKIIFTAVCCARSSAS